MTTKIEQLPTQVDIALVQGDDWSITLTFAEDGTPKDLSAYEIEAKVGGAVIDVDMTDAADGEITLSLTDEDTAALSTTPTPWYLAWTLDDDTRTVLAGKVAAHRR